jgi:hypothetical protein
VVHARFDFHHDKPVTTVQVLADLVSSLSRTWQARGRARFTRFTLGLIAVQVSLDGMPPEQAKETLRASIDNFARYPTANRLAAAVPALADGAEQANILTTEVAQTTKAVLPTLIRTLGRRPLRKAKRWHADMPEAEGATALDALFSLNRRAQHQPKEIIPWLTAAFLADVRENHPRMAAPDGASPCNCPESKRTEHWHNWVVLLDDIDCPSGAQFVTDLLGAREEHLRQRPDEHDALLCIATSGRWNPDWESVWRPPWKPAPAEPGRARTIPLCRKASYAHWTCSASDQSPPRLYPVLLEPLDIGETARILGTSRSAPTSELAQRATGGLPAAIQDLAGLLEGQDLRPGARNVLVPTETTPSNPRDDPLWARLNHALLAQYLPDLGIEEFVTAAPFATAPWLVPHDATSLSEQPHIGSILTELRTSLWVTVHTPGEGMPPHVGLHPWIARTLISALVRRTDDSTGPTYRTQFETLLEDPDTSQNPVRRSYCQLALGQVSAVVNYFESTFDQIPHQEWIDQLRLVTHAPNDLTLTQDPSELYAALLQQANPDRPQDRSSVGNIIARLVVTSWLAADPFAVPHPQQREIIERSYRELAPLSRRPDVIDLYRAAQLAKSGLL